MKLTMAALQDLAATRLDSLGIAEARDIAWASAWLEACGYPGIKLLAEALSDPVRDRALQRDALGLDLDHVSCVFLAPRIMRDVEANGRVFLRNVRHGLYMLPFTVRSNLGIGCPVDPAFAVGGERTKNPYAEKLALAEANGVEVDETALLPPVGERGIFAGRCGAR